MPTLQRATRISLCCSAMLIAGCAKKDNAAVDTSSTTVASTTASTTSAAPAPIHLADVAGKWKISSAPASLGDVSGKWKMSAVPASGDTTRTKYVLNGTGNASGWSFNFAGRPPV